MSFAWIWISLPYSKGETTSYACSECCSLKVRCATWELDWSAVGKCDFSYEPWFFVLWWWCTCVEAMRWTIPSNLHTENWNTKLVWGAITAKGIDMLSAVSGWIIWDKYVNVLENNLIPTFDLYFPGKQLHFSRASCHTSAETRAWFADQNVKILPWPANSPNLLPIKYVWQDRKLKYRKWNPKIRMNY